MQWYRDNFVNLWKKTLQNLHLHYHQNHQHFCVSAALGQAEGKPWWELTTNCPSAGHWGRNWSRRHSPQQQIIRDCNRKKKKWDFVEFLITGGSLSPQGTPRGHTGMQSSQHPLQPPKKQQGAAKWSMKAVLRHLPSALSYVLIKYSNHKDSF